jgi:hypothetical protein
VPGHDPQSERSVDVCVRVCPFVGCTFRALLNPLPALTVDKPVRYRLGRWSVCSSFFHISVDVLLGRLPLFVRRAISPMQHLRASIQLSTLYLN